MTERLSAALRIPPEEASQLMDEAASWRTTKKGRSLIDRKLRKTVLVNVPVVLELFLDVYQLTPTQVRVFVVVHPPNPCCTESPGVALLSHRRR